MSDEATHTVRTTWIDGLRFAARGSASGAAMLLDGAPEHGGEGSAIRPMEALLASLAGCTGMDVISILQKKRQQVSGFAIEVRGWRAAEHPRRYERIAMEYIVRGRDISEAAVARAIELSQEKYCGVTASLNAEISHTYRIEAE